MIIQSVHGSIEVVTVDWAKLIKKADQSILDAKTQIKALKFALGQDFKNSGLY